MRDFALDCHHVSLEIYLIVFRVLTGQNWVADFLRRRSVLFEVIIVEIGGRRNRMKNSPARVEIKSMTTTPPGLKIR